jgi:hypothetical protein
MMDSGELEKPASRALQLFFERWREQLETSFAPRRARTLGAISALDELIALAEGYVRSGGSTRPAIDPDDAGHGVRMLPDVAAEAAEVVAGDQVLSGEYPKRKEVLAELARLLAAKENVSPQVIEQLKALIGAVRMDYCAAGFRTLRALVKETPKSHGNVISLADSIVSELRSNGWSDEGLRDAAERAQGEGRTYADALTVLQESVSVEVSAFECYVAVALPQKLPGLQLREPSFAFVQALPSVARHGRAMKDGPYLRASIAARDAAAAAAIAHQRSVATLGALKVFVPGSQGDVSSEVVGVLTPEGLRSFEVQERLLEEHRSSPPGEILRVLQTSWRAHESRTADPLHDAIRLRHRALVASDPESRLLLLWSGMERMTAGARSFESALSAAKELISHAVGFGKLRRDVQDLMRGIARHVGKDSERSRAWLQRVGARSGNGSRSAQVRFLKYLMAPEAQLRELVSLVYETSPLLALRCHELWKALGSGRPDSIGDHLAEYHERSRERVARQVGRIYRARNRIAHVGASHDRVRDLVLCALRGARGRAGARISVASTRPIQSIHSPAQGQRP